MKKTVCTTLLMAFSCYTQAHTDELDIKTIIAQNELHNKQLNQPVEFTAKKASSHDLEEEQEENRQITDPEYDRRRKIIEATAVTPENMRKNLAEIQKRSFQKSKRGILYSLRYLFPCYWCQGKDYQEYCLDVLKEADHSL